MAYLIRNEDSELTPLEHSSNIFKQYLKQITLKGFMGKKDSGKPIIVDSTLERAAGESVRFHFIPQNTSDGILGQDTAMEGNEQSLDEYYVDVTVDQLRQGFRRKGDMTKQRLIWDARSEFKMQLSHWFAQNTENQLIWAMTGIVTGMTKTYTATTNLVYGKNRCMYASGAGSAQVDPATGNTGVVESSDNTALAALMTSADKMTARLIEDAAIMAKEEDPWKIQPVKISDGREFYILLVSLRVLNVSISNSISLISEPLW